MNGIGLTDVGNAGEGWILNLVIRAQHGDRDAFALLATGIADRFLAVGRKILRDFDLAEDATQQALLSIWRDLPQLRGWPSRKPRWASGAGCALD